jgi:phosphoglycerate dehydrogenase-like enzyme
VLESEPPDPNDPILKLDNVILAPHALCWTDQCFAGNGAADVKAVLDIQHGRCRAVSSTGAVLDQPRFKARLEAYRSRFGG